MSNDLQVKFMNHNHAMQFAWLFKPMAWELKQYQPFGLEALVYDCEETYVWTFNIYQPGKYFQNDTE